MTPVELGTAVLVGAAVLALWVDARLGERTPQTMIKVLLHAGAAFIAVRFVAAFAPRILDPESTAKTIGALLLLVLPGWIYAFLASFWALKLVRSAIPR